MIATPYAAATARRLRSRIVEDAAFVLGAEAVYLACDTIKIGRAHV